MKCTHCRRGDRLCVAEAVPAFAHVCAKAERGTPSDLAQIEAMSERLATTPTPTSTPYPSPAKQVVSAVKAAASFVASGGKRVERAEYDRRLAICTACEYHDAKANRCRLCGCMLKLKPWAVSGSCPVGKW